MTDRPITLVLDASAVAAYTRESIHVGEVLAEVGDDRAVAAVPLACLVAAAVRIVDTDRLDVLVSHSSVAVVGDDAGAWRALAAAHGLVDSYECAVAALLAMDTDAAVLTRHPERYHQIDRGGLVIPITG